MKSGGNRVTPQALLWALLIYALGVNTARAQGDGLDQKSQRDLLDLRDMSLEQLMSVPLSTGSFLELDLHTSPIALTFIDRTQIKASAARTLSELLEIYVPGFQYMVNKWNGDIWGMRGVANDRNTKIIFLVNGLKQNTEGRDGNYTEMDLGLLDDIERVEVLRGPAGLVYGSGSIAGVVNVVTRRPNLTSGNAATSYGSGNSIGGEGLAHVQGERWSLTLAAGYRRSLGLGDRNTRIYGGLSFPTPLDESFSPVALPHGIPADGSMGRTPGNYRISADIRFRDDVRWYTRYTHRQTAAGPYFAVDAFPGLVGFPTADTPPSSVNGSWVGPNSRFARTESFSTSRREYLVDNLSSHLSYTPRIGPDRLTLEAALIAAQNRTNDAFRDGYAVPDASNPAGRLDSTFGERRYYLAAQYLLQRVAKLESATGVSLRVDDLGKDFEGLNLHGGLQARPEIADIVYTNVALYNETHYLPIEQLRLIAGLRLDKHTRTSYVVNATGAAVYMPNPLHSLKLSVRTAANNGSVDNYEHNYSHYRLDGSLWTEAHLQEGPENVRPTFAIPAVSRKELHALKPERIYAIELASTHTLWNALTIGPSVSYSRISNLFSWAHELQHVVNSGAYGVLALELDARADLHSLRLSAGASHVYQRPIAPDRSAQKYSRPAWEAYQLDDGLWDVRETGEATQENINTVSAQVTRDGRNFLNLATNVTKLYLDYAPIKWLHLHTDARIFWGLPGRHESVKANIAAGHNTLGISRLPIIKWNIGVRAQLPQGFVVGFHVYNLLASDRNRHAVRWQQMSDASQSDLYTVDLRYFAGMLEKEF